MPHVNAACEGSQALSANGRAGQTEGIPGVHFKGSYEGRSPSQKDHLKDKLYVTLIVTL